MIRQKMIRYILLIAVFQLTLAESESYDLMVRGKSNPYCKISPDHTMCKYEAETDCRSNSKYRKINKAGQKIVVDAHNALRRKVATGGEELGVGGGQPGAANMKEIRWSKELAKIAQRWTDQCTFGHDKKRNKKDGTYVGQNAFIRGGSRQQSKDEVTASLENGVKAWYNEVKDWDSSKINPFQ